MINGKIYPAIIKDALLVTHWYSKLLNSRKISTFVMLKDLFLGQIIENILNYQPELNRIGVKTSRDGVSTYRNQYQKSLLFLFVYI
jgi:hypothetical protein